MKKILFLFLLIMIAGSCNNEATDDEYVGRVVNPSFTTYNFGVEGGSVTLTGDVWWSIGYLIEATDSNGVPFPRALIGFYFPEGEAFETVSGYIDNMGGQHFMELKVKGSWLTITRETVYKAIIEVQPNTSGNERRISFEMARHVLGVPVTITQSAE